MSNGRQREEEFMYTGVNNLELRSSLFQLGSEWRGRSKRDTNDENKTRMRNKGGFRWDLGRGSSLSHS